MAVRWRDACGVDHGVGGIVVTLPGVEERAERVWVWPIGRWDEDRSLGLLPG